MDIPPVVIDRLPLYTRALSALEAEAREVVSSQELGTRLGVTPAQIRKDLSYFGRFGKQGRGYNVTRLHQELREILGLSVPTGSDWGVTAFAVVLPILVVELQKLGARSRRAHHIAA